MRQTFLLYLCMAALCSCSEKPTNVTAADTLPPIYPDYAGVTIPAQIAPLNFNVEGADKVYVTVRGADGTEIVGKGTHADFDIHSWHILTAANTGSDLTVSVCAKADGKWVRYSDFTITVSPYPLDAWGLTYRRIAPGYEVYSHMGIFQRDLATFSEYPVMENTPTPGHCYNCHTSNRTDPSQFVFHVRGPHGATMVQQGGERTWLQATNDTLGGSMVYPYWHPSGRYCAFSTNQTRQGFHIAGDKRLEVFDYSSDVLVYDTQTRQILLDPLVSTKDWSENIPTFSPDGRTLYYTTCLQKSYPLEYKEEQYNLCRVDFDPEQGRLGERVDTIFDAVSMGKSVTWPRPSYDGRYMLFTLVDYGYFSVWHKEAEQWLLDLSTGEARCIDEINSDDADSYHNWSSNSHWVVFTSRRDDGLYSRPYLTEVNDRGEFSKPVLLPQRDPAEYYGRSLYSFNTPDFTSRRVEFDNLAAVDEITSDQRVKTTVRK